MTSEERIEVLFIQHHNLNTMASAQFVFYLTCLILGEMARMDNLNLYTPVRQERRFLSGKTGDNMTLRCFYEGDAVMLYWYKQTLGQEPRLISTSYKHDIDGTFYNEFQSDPRFTLVRVKGKNHLKITNLHISDSATYYCASSYLFTLDFAEGTTINVNHSGLNFQTLAQQATSKAIQPGDAVTLNCTVNTGTCDGERSVYWFRTEGESYPGLIHTCGGRKDNCEKEPNTQTHTCVYNLPLKSLNLSNVGTYYCAANLSIGPPESRVLVYFLSGALAFTTILMRLLASLLYRTKRKSYQTTGKWFSLYLEVLPLKIELQKHHFVKNLRYVAVSMKKANRSRRHRKETEDKMPVLHCKGINLEICVCV
uniref:Ig-like domain-containing protein n=1 Tax=Acanthochromis polyacanthus TaxID=80966 RepID=A0A3Q1FXZ9_9TELE